MSLFLLKSFPFLVVPLAGGYFVSNSVFLESSTSSLDSAEKESESLTVSNPTPPKVASPVSTPKISVPSASVVRSSPAPQRSPAGTKDAGYKWKVEGIQSWANNREGDGQCNIYEIQGQNDDGITFTFKSYTKRDRAFLKTAGISNRIGCDTNRHFYVYYVFDFKIIKQSSNAPIANDA